MSNNSIQSIVKSYEFDHKKLAYYRLVRDAAKKEIDDNESRSYPRTMWKAKEAYTEALRFITYYQREIEQQDENNGINSEYIQSLCSLTPDDDKHTERAIKGLVEKFISVIDSTRKDPIWLTLTADGIQPGEGDDEWYNLLFEQKSNPQYTRNYKVNELDKPHTDLKRIATSCAIVVEDLSTRVRLTYADTDGEPMANTYVFYWMYGDESTALGEKLATTRKDTRFFDKINCMLPLGIGLTDENGYLVQTRQMGRSMNKYQTIDLDEATFELNPGIAYGGWDTVSIIKHGGFLDYDAAAVNDADTYRAKQESLKLARKKWLNTTYYEEKLADYNPIEKLGINSGSGSLPLLTAQARILHSYVSNGYFVDGQDRTLEDLSIAERDELEKVSTQYFFPDRKYGFFAYPVNRGSFKTKSLLELAEGDDPVAWSGKVDEDNNSIALHCTLPEWDRRITVKLDALNLALHKTAEKVKPHTENIERLTGMSRLVGIHQKFPYGLRDQDQIDTGEILIGKIDKLAEAITESIKEPNDDREFLNEKDVQEIYDAAYALKELIFKKEFLFELNAYLKIGANIEDGVENGLSDTEGSLNPGPYMKKEPYWGHIIETLTQCVVSISKTHLSELVWTKWIDPMLEHFANQIEVIEKIENLADEEMFAEFISAGKVLNEVPEDGKEPDSVIDYRIRLSRSFKKIQDSVEADEQARLDKEGLDLEHNNPLLWVLNCYKGVAAPLTHRSHGAPSILQQVIDLYSDKISEKMTSSFSFNIKFNVALFRFCGVDMEGDKTLLKSYMNKIAITGYMAKSKDLDPKQHIKRLRKADGVKNQKLDEQIRTVINSIASKATGGQPLSDTIYDASFHSRWYKTVMFLTTLGMNANTFSELPEKLKDETRYGKTLFIMQAAGETLYTATLARQGFGIMLGQRFTNMLDGVNPGGQALSSLVGEGAARYLAVISMLFSMRSAADQYELGNDSSAALHLATAINTAHVQLAYAAQKGIGRGVLTNIVKGAAKRGVVTEVMAIGLASLTAPVVGEMSLIIASSIAASLVVLDVYNGIQASGKASTYHMFNHYLNTIAESQIPILNDKHCHELYTANQLPSGANDLYSEIKDISDNNFYEWDSYTFTNLSWRAVVPLYLQGFSMDSIRVMVELPEGTTELTRRVRDESFQGAWMVQTVDDIISYYESMANPEFKDERMPSGRKKIDISIALANGIFIPAPGHEEELEIMKDGRKHIISFDHLYFRKGASENGPSPEGASWEQLDERSNEISRSIQHV